MVLKDLQALMLQRCNLSGLDLIASGLIVLSLSVDVVAI